MSASPKRKSNESPAAGGAPAGGGAGAPFEVPAAKKRGTIDLGLLDLGASTSAGKSPASRSSALALPANAVPPSPAVSSGGRSSGGRRRRGSEPATNPYIDSLVQQSKSPAEVAELVVARLLDGDVSEEDTLSLNYVKSVLYNLQLDASMSHVPALLQGTADINDVDTDTAQYLRSNFTPVDHARKKKTVKSLKSVTKGMRFALRLQRSSTTRMITSGYDLPYQASEEEIASITKVLGGCDKWDFDVFELKKATGGRELMTLAWHLLQRFDLFNKFSLDKQKMMAWLSHVAEIYCDTPYHNQTHATDVLQTVNFMLSTAGVSEFLSEIHILAVILAAVVHDAGHDGFNNTYHKNAMTERAIFFNDQSIQENYHVSTIFTHTLQNEEVNWLSQMPSAQSKEIRRMVIAMVLGTDMTTHFTHLKEFKTAFEQSGTETTEWEPHVDILLCQLLHVADISNPAKPRGAAMEWARRVLDECFKQGDLEKEMGITISPMCNRDTTVMAQTQIGFIKFIVLPTYEQFGQLLPEVKKTCVTMLEDNLAYWQEQANAAKE